MDPLSFFSQEELSTWAAQADLNSFLHLTTIGIKVLFALVVVGAGVHVALRRGCERLGLRIYGGSDKPRRVFRVFERLSDPTGNEPSRWVTDLVYPIALTMIWSVVILPISYFGSFVLGHERGLVTMSAGLWWSDWAKSMLLGSVFYGFLGVGLFGLARRLPRTWWLLLWGAVAGMLLVWSMLSPYRAKLYNEFKELAPGPARTAVESIMAKAGIKLSHVQVVNTSKRSRHAAAFVMGTGPTRRVVLGDNLVRRFHPREIMVALGHELGHEREKHQDRGWISLSLAALVFLILVRLILLWAPRVRRLGLRPDADPAVLPIIFLMLLILFSANSPLSAWLDRQEEHEADMAGLELTRDPVAFCSLMVRLARTNQADVDPPEWRHWFWEHHPTVKQRIEYAMKWGKEHHVPVGPGAVPLYVDVHR